MGIKFWSIQTSNPVRCYAPHLDALTSYSRFEYYKEFSTGGCAYEYDVCLRAYLQKKTRKCKTRVIFKETILFTFHYTSQYTSLMTKALVHSSFIILKVINMNNAEKSQHCQVVMSTIC